MDPGPARRRTAGDPDLEGQRLEGQTDVGVQQPGGELTQLRINDVHLDTGPHVSCIGKGRKQRITPLTAGTVTLLRAWLVERAGQPDDPLFPTRRGTTLTRDALERRVTTHAATAALTCPTLHDKKISPHAMRHPAVISPASMG